MTQTQPTLSPAADAPRSGSSRLLAVPARLLGGIFLPDRTVPGEVQAGRYGAVLLLVTAVALTVSLVIGARLDVSQDVQVSDPVEGGKPGEETLRGEHEIAEDVAKTHAMRRVTMALWAGFGTPAQLLFLALGLYLVARYVGGRPTLRRTMTLAAYAAIPGTLHAILVLVAALRAPRVASAELGRMWTIMPLPLGLDPFLLWAGVLVALGFPAAASISRAKGLVTATVCFGLFLCLRQIMGVR